MCDLKKCNCRGFFKQWREMVYVYFATGESVPYAHHQKPAISCAFGARCVLLFTAENMKGLSRLPLNFFAQHY